MTSASGAGANSPAPARSLPPAWSPSPSPASSSPSAASLASGSAADGGAYSARSSATTAVQSGPGASQYDSGATRYDPSASYENPGSPPRQNLPRGHDDPSFSPRIARLTVASIDPFSVLKLSFLLSVAAGVALVVAAVVLWMVLQGIGVFDQLNNLFGTIGGLDTPQDKFDIYDYVGLNRVLSISIVIGVADVILLTAVCTVSAFLYNLGAGLVGGVRVTLSDD